MTREEKILKGISELGRQPVVIIPGVVKSVDESKGSAVVTDLDGIDKNDVRIKGAIDEKETGLFIIPKAGSSVLIGRIQESNEWVILACSDIDNVILNIGKKITLKNDQTTFKSILNDLITEVKNAIIQTPAGTGNISPATQAKLDLIDNKINQLFDA